MAGLDREALPELYLDALQAAWGRAEDAEEHEHEQMAKQVQALSYRVMQVGSLSNSSHPCFLNELVLHLPKLLRDSKTCPVLGRPDGARESPRGSGDCRI